MKAATYDRGVTAESQRPAPEFKAEGRDIDA